MGSNLPQDPSAIGRRDLVEILERHRERSASIVPAIVVSVKGSQFIVVRDAGSEQQRTVANPTGRTHAPGSRVFLGSNAGHGPEFVISGPPGEGGSGTSSSRPYKIELPNTTPDAVAFFWTGSLLAATYYYIGGDSAAAIGSSSESGTCDYFTFIRRDSRSYVSPFSLAYSVQDEARISCFDPSTETVHSYTATGYMVSGVTYNAGRLWWVEGEETQHGAIGTYATYFRLRRANCDLTDVETVASFEYDNGPAAFGSPHIDLDWRAISPHISMASGVVVVANWQDGINHEVAGSIRIVCSFAGVITHDEDPADPSDATVEDPVAVNDHATYGTPLFGGAFPLTL
jgi:hypothetical protein